MATLFEIASLNWVERSRSELRRRDTKRFRDSTIRDALFWKRVAEFYGRKFSW
ncbi:MAG TPA: hypothetical protein VIP46_02695 [Pyrinomonadaceae bacterium]